MTVLLRGGDANLITSTVIDTFKKHNADFITVQELYKISDEQFDTACGYMVRAACKAANVPSCDGLEYVKNNVCANRASKLMLKVRDLMSYTWIKNENTNRGDDKVLVQESKIPYISDMQKHNPVTSPKSTSELMTELNYVFTAYESGHFRVRNHSSVSIPKPPPANPAGVKKLQVTYFNGERGSFWLKQCEIFRNDPMLNGSDVIFFNELDLGMARSGNFDTANMLATCISMNYVYAVEFIEFSLGIGREVKRVNMGQYPITDKKNLVGYHGNAIMSKFPLSNIELVSLNGTQDFWRKGGPSKEFRIGERMAIFATVSLDSLRSHPDSGTKIDNSFSNSIDLVVTHLDARLGEAYNTKSMKTIASTLKRRNAKGGSIVAGDLGNPGLDESAAANYLFTNENFLSPWLTNRISRVRDPRPRGDWIMVSGGSMMEPIPGSVAVIDSQKLSDHSFITAHMKLNGI